jgi:hypothetical protein
MTSRLLRPLKALTLLIGLLALSLTACFPATAPNGKPPLEWSRPAPGKVVVTANMQPTLLITSSTAIGDGWQPKAACVRSENSEIAARALKCTVKTIPLTITVLTDGVVSLQIVDGFKPITPPVIVPRLNMPK